MWTEEKLKEAAERYENEVYDHAFDEGKWYLPSKRDIFLAGCKYIINNTQKEQ